VRGLLVDELMLEHLQTRKGVDLSPQLGGRFERRL